ncbi:BppU family phage baseplate upper protein, partial [Clostridioides difficile]|uniref:BppU family phage baseplate upper protein n=1 Tax=Clostridioides difficile TaxID=1496 RepID=UPI001CA47BBE
LVNITKSDGFKVNGECEVVDAVNGVVEIELSRQALSSVGINTFQLSLVKGGALINTTNLYYRVEEGM